MSTTIFEKSRSGRRAFSQSPGPMQAIRTIPENFQRKQKPQLPEMSELDVVRHFTNLSRKNFSIDTHFYPLGSCTMKYNPRAHRLAWLPEFAGRHPLAQPEFSQGTLQCLFELQDYLKISTGMPAVSLAPMAGAQGEFAGVAMIRRYHEANNDSARTEILVPDAAHGTNPASAVMCGYKVREIPTSKEGDIDIDALKAAVGPQTAGIMLTNPSTLGVFGRKIIQVAEIVHGAGGLLYYDGANLNAILGQVRPVDMGFDVVHLNLHKTFSTPHGGGGPGAGPVAANEKLAKYLPVPMVGMKDNQFYWLTEQQCPETIGRLSTFMGNAGVLLRAYIYIRLLGRQGLERVSEFATLNANYLMKRLQEVGYELAFPTRLAAHEFIITLKKLAKEKNVTATDVAKRLLDYDMHAPTIYFPLIVPECMLIEPTETESKQTLDAFIDVMAAILKEAETDPAIVKQAPTSQPVKRLDDVKAARELNIVWRES